MYLLNRKRRRHWKKSACVKRRSDSPASLSAFNIIDSFLTFKQPKRPNKHGCSTLPLPTEEKRNTSMDWRHPTYHWSSQAIEAVWDSYVKTHHSQHRQQREGEENIEWERVIGSLTRLLQCFWLFDEKQLQDVSGNNYAPMFTRWYRPISFHFQWSSRFS